MLINAMKKSPGYGKVPKGCPNKDAA